ncbi:hypothetical protein cyc_02829 [Cyclospora cayetanensis]|uniref:Uncharacterized protein n=1 Tax=Cyclospora cayetanensis TaxID=88456 RepID=A0A1D3D319_9EIME|nr:hypothetical protein cyc_02829 [Cyclospora cayetanensis]
MHKRRRVGLCSLLELRGRPEVVLAFLRLFEDLNARGKELHLQREQRKKQQQAAAEADGQQDGAHAQQRREGEEQHQAKEKAAPPQSGEAADSDDTSDTLRACSFKDVAFLRKVYLSTIRRPRVHAKLAEIVTHWEEEHHALAKQQQLDDLRARRHAEREKWFAAKGMDLPFLEETARQLQLNAENVQSLQEFFKSPNFDLQAWLDEPPPGRLAKDPPVEQQEEG